MVSDHYPLTRHEYSENFKSWYTDCYTVSEMAQPTNPNEVYRIISEPKDYKFIVKNGGNINGLIALLEIRAKNIELFLKEGLGKGIWFDKEVSNGEVEEFISLHKQHIEFLRKGLFSSAHEVLIKIHELSFKISFSRYYKLMYQSAPPGDIIDKCVYKSYIRGFLIDWYITGEYSISISGASHKYPLTEHEEEYKDNANKNTYSNDCRNRNRYTVQEMAQPASPNEIYRMLSIPKDSLFH
jgi:hypothetical protein